MPRRGIYTSPGVEDTGRPFQSDELQEEEPAVAVWMVEPFAEVRNLKERCLGGGKKGEEVNVSHLMMNFKCLRSNH